MPRQAPKTEKTPEPFVPDSTRGQECLDLINSLRTLGSPEEEIRRAALIYWTGEEPSLSQNS